MPAILEGLSIVEVSSFHNGTAAGYMLGDLGADVIKVEQPNVGDPSRGFQFLTGSPAVAAGGRSIVFEAGNRNKKSVTLNLDCEDGRRILYRLITSADVFITNHRSDVVSRLGISYETLNGLNSRLVYLQASALGLKGPDRDLRGFDPIAQARSGIMWAIGDRDSSEPNMLSGGMLDQLGAFTGAFGIVAALYHRCRTGEGQKVETSLFGSALFLQTPNLTFLGMRQRDVQRHARRGPINPLANHYCCADGQWLLLSELQSDRFWHDFCEALQITSVEHDPRFSDATNRRKNSGDLCRIIEVALAQRARDDWIRRFHDLNVGFAYAPVLSLAEAANDTHARENRYVVEHDYPDLGRISVSGFPVHFDMTPAAIQSPAPELGQHTEEILVDRLGLSWEDIVRLRDSGVI